LIEIPLTIMDAPLFSNKGEDIWKDCINIMNIVEKHQGILTLLWHHAVFNNYEYPGWTERYEKIIEICKEKNAWITNAYNIIEWLTMREKANISNFNYLGSNLGNMHNLQQKILYSNEAVQQFKIGRKRRGNRALNPKRSEIFSDKSNYGTASIIML